MTMREQINAMEETMKIFSDRLEAVYKLDERSTICDLDENHNKINSTERAVTPSDKLNFLYAEWEVLLASLYEIGLEIE